MSHFLPVLFSPSFPDEVESSCWVEEGVLLLSLNSSFIKFILSSSETKPESAEAPADLLLYKFECLLLLLDSEKMDRCSRPTPSVVISSWVVVY